MFPTSPSRILTGIAIAILLLASPAAAFSTSMTVIRADPVPGMTTIIPVTFSLSATEPAGTFALAVAGLGQSPFDMSYTALDAASDTSPYSARPFITLDHSTVSLLPGRQAVVNASIRLPADARDGGRYAAIAVYRAAAPADRQAGSPVAIIPVLINTGGENAPVTAEISAIEVTDTGAGNAGQVATYVVNTGSRPVSGAVNTVTITDHQGTVLAWVATAPSGSLIIPGQEVRFSVSFDGGFPAGAAWITTRIGLSDGTLLTEKDEVFDKVADEPEPQGTTITEQPATRTRMTPGFGTGIALSGIPGLWYLRRWFQKA